MKNSPNFVPYDDNNLDHVNGGPDYGQEWSGCTELSWSENVPWKSIEDYYCFLLRKGRILKLNPIKF